MNIFERFQHIDRRVMYLFLALVIAAPLIWDLNLPIADNPAVTSAYRTVEEMPADKLAVISIWWAAGTKAENEPQTEVIMRHLFRNNRKFAILSWDIQGSQLAPEIATRLAKEMGKEYGKDWVDLGFRPPSSVQVVIQGMTRDLPKALTSDRYGTPLAKIPMMRGIRNKDDVGLVAEITPSATLGLWIAFFKGPPIVYAPTAVMAPEAYNFLDAEQISGMLPGMQGAAVYEQLLNAKGFATKGTGALSASHVLIILLIIIGNIGYLSSRRREGRS
ncbi:MAG: hypothetical protein ACYC2Y_07975 [Armatimonadota bacterium]